MRRREFVTLVGGAAAASCAGPFAAFAQAPAKRPRIVYLGASLPGPAAKTTAAFIEGMGALGYTEGRDFTMEYRWAEGHVERLPALAQELVRRGTDVICPVTVKRPLRRETRRKRSRSCARCSRTLSTSAG